MELVAGRLVEVSRRAVRMDVSDSVCVVVLRWLGGGADTLLRRRGMQAGLGSSAGKSGDGYA